MDLQKKEKKRERESILPNFHCSKNAKIYPSLGLQKSRLLFCKHPVFYSGGVGLKAGEAVGSLGHLGEQRAGQNEAQRPTPCGREAVKAGPGPRGAQHWGL